MTVESQTPAESRPVDKSLTAVEFRHSPNLVPLLQERDKAAYRSAFAISSRPWAWHARPPACVGTRRQIWFLPAAPDLAARVKPAGRHDGCFLARQAHFTGSIMAHDLAWCAGDLWVVNTLFSCLCVLRPEYSFVPRWRPSFISALAAEDRCHLNGLATDEHAPRYVTALGECDTAAGWRPGKASGGCLIDVAFGKVILRGLCMPHSPRLHQGQLWLLDSGRGTLNRCNPARGQVDTVASLPGYTRGLDCFGRFAFVGLSRIRETSVFGGLPIAERRDELRCGVAIVDLGSGQTVAVLQFLSGVEEVFEVKVLPGFRDPIVSGPFPDVDDAETLWVVPPENSIPKEVQTQRIAQ